MASQLLASRRSLRGRRRAGRRQQAAAYLFLAPFFIVFLAMLVVPLVYSGYLSTFTSTLVGGNTFVGLDNYTAAFTDAEFLASLRRMLAFLAIQVPIMLGLALFLALALDSGRVRGSRALRLLYFMPYAVPGVIGAMMWGFLYAPAPFGPIARFTEAVGLSAPNLLSDGNILGAIMNIVTWAYVGYNMIIMYAALRSVPTDLYEAAAIDGAGQFRIAWSIKLPALRPAILLTLIFSVIGTFQLFNEPAILERAAPTAINNSFSPNWYAYNLAFTNQNLNYAAAIAFSLGIVIAVLSYVVQLTARSRSRKASA